MVRLLCECRGSVICFSHEHAHRILTIVPVELWTRRRRVGECLIDPSGPLDWESEDESANEWLERTPVMTALRRRQQIIGRPRAGLT